MMASDADPGRPTEGAVDPGHADDASAGSAGAGVPDGAESTPAGSDERLEAARLAQTPTGVAATPTDPVAEPAQTEEPTRGKRGRAPNMLPGRERRTLGLERLFVRLIATSGVVGIGVAIAAILANSKTQGWIIGLVVALVSVICSAILWSSRQL